jgi:hypothetical protein
LIGFSIIRITRRRTERFQQQTRGAGDDGDDGFDAGNEPGQRPAQGHGSRGSADPPGAAATSRGPAFGLARASQDIDKIKDSSRECDRLSGGTGSRRRPGRGAAADAGRPRCDRRGWAAGNFSFRGSRFLMYSRAVDALRPGRWTPFGGRLIVKGGCRRECGNDQGHGTRCHQRWLVLDGGGRLVAGGLTAVRAGVGKIGVAPRTTGASRVS